MTCGCGNDPPQALAKKTERLHGEPADGAKCSLLAVASDEPVLDRGGGDERNIRRPTTDADLRPYQDIAICLSTPGSGDYSSSHPGAGQRGCGPDVATPDSSV